MRAISQNFRQSSHSWASAAHVYMHGAKDDLSKAESSETLLESYYAATLTQP